MDMPDQRHVGYLCPVCVVRFPYCEKLAEHWSKFHCKFKDELRTYPSLASAARRNREEKNYRLISTASSVTSQESRKKVFGPAPPPNFNNAKRKRQYPIILLHNFQRRTVNEHVPQICQICDQMVWHHANFCKDCGYVCHLECQHANVNTCGMKMQLPTKTNGESTSDEQIGDIRPCQSSSLHIKRSASSNARKKEAMESTELDLTYITDRLIAMTFPASGQEAEYRTKLLTALKHLQNKHMENFRIINVSERRYDILQLNEPGQVVDYGWPDHLAPPLDKISQIISSIHYWLEGDIKNVAVIHCKGGKSRIGLVIASYIQFSKNSPSPQGALDWFALRRFYDKKLDGAMHPSQKRYVSYYGDRLDKRLQISNTPLLFQNMIFHGVPLYGNNTGLRFRMKIYQGYHLVHTTKTFFVPSDCDRFTVSFDDDVQLRGDIMLKCIEQGNISQNVIFRLQFHSDAIDSSVALFGKYDLDEAFTDYRFPDSSHVELIFAPSQRNTKHKTNAIGTERRYKCAIFKDITNQSPTDYISTDQSNLTIGIFEKEREMTTALNSKSNYMPGPLDGNPYAQIDPHLKKRLRLRPSHHEVSLQRGIEDLDGLLGDLGYTNTAPDYNGNTYQKTSSPKYHKSYSTESDITPEKSSVVNCAPLRMGSNGSFSDDVFAGRSGSITVNDLLFELDHSPLNSCNSLKRSTYKKKPNASVYDNDLEDSDVMSDRSRNDSVDGEMEIQPGIVAQHVRTLNKVLFREVNDYNLKYGVPLAGVNSPDLVEQKISAFNSRSVAPGFCSPPPNQIYHSQGTMTKVEYKRGHSGEDDHPYVLTDEENGCSIDPDYTARMESLLSRSDSAYGESMRSSSPSPAVTPISISSQRTNDGHQDSNNNLTKHDIKHIEHNVPNGHRYHWQQEDEGYGKDQRDDHHDLQYKQHHAPVINHADARDYHVSTHYSKPTHNHHNQDHAPTVIHLTSRDNHVVTSHPIQNHHQENQVPTVYHVTSRGHHVAATPTSQGYHHQDHHAPIGNHVETRDHPAASIVAKPNHQQHHHHDHHVNFTSDIVDGDERFIAKHNTTSNQREVKLTPNFAVVKNAPPPSTSSYTTTSTIHIHPHNHQQMPTTATNDVVDTPVTNIRINSIPKNELLLQTRTEQDTPQPSSKKRTLAVVEERIQPSQVQKEVECMNEDIFKNLIDEDLLKPTHQAYRMPTSSPVRSHNERLTSSSTEDEVQTEARQMNGGQKVTPPVMPLPYEASISPPSARRFPPLMEALHARDANDAYGIHLIEQPHTHTRTRTYSNNSSTSDEATSPRSPCGSGRNTLRHRKFRSSGSSNSSISSGELFPEVVKYPSIKFHKDTMNLWYKPSISRDEATNMLKNREPGAFLVRDSQSYEGAFGLAVKVDTPPQSVLQLVNGDITKINLENELVRHFLIEPCKKGVRLKGSNDEPAFPSLVALIYQHSLTKMALPISLVIPEFDSVDGPRNGIRASGLSESQLLEKGAACNLVYLGAVKVDTLTGDGAVQYAMNKVTSPNIQLKTTTVNIKVNQQGITLTDNNRRMFFRRHFPMDDILHCGVDPKNRKVNLKALVENGDREVGCFGFVVKKQANSPENHCHVFAELEPDQPTTAVINFIHKAMRYSRV